MVKQKTYEMKIHLEKLCAGMQKGNYTCRQNLEGGFLPHMHILFQNFKNLFYSIDTSDNCQQRKLILRTRFPIEKLLSTWDIEPM